VVSTEWNTQNKKHNGDTMQNHAVAHKRKRIVLATIDRGIEDSLRKKFAELQYEFNTVQHSLEAVIDLLENDIDLLIIDMDLYGNVSLDVLPVIRKLRPRIPIVLISDDLTHCVRKIAAEQGVTFQAGKPRDPIDMNHIVEVVEKIIAKQELMQVN
jgi:two-component system, NtrC family, nitrogen regulation response regulator GlnG